MIKKRLFSTTFGVSANSGVKPVSPCDLKEGDTFYILLESNLGYVNDNTRIEERKVEEINVWTEHWEIPDYLGGEEDCRECRMKYSFFDEDTGLRDTVVFPKVPHNWLIFRTEKEAAQYAIDYLEAEQEMLRKDLKGLEELKEKFQRLL